MATPKSGDAKKYYRVANQRLEDARFLMRGQRQTAAMYLAGYAVECILKSLLLESTPKKDQGDLAKSFRGPQGHSIIGLRGPLCRQGTANTKGNCQIADLGKHLGCELTIRARSH